MSAVPKTKVSRARRDSRRANSFKLKLPGLGECPRCHVMKRSHSVCPSCGYYKGREVINVDDK
ncbi:MAG: 50S ribosomal protein L32 [Symbiobacteriaceae bacterium]|nr:50S ribosomal protein L32 [Symbiobacteriaceae bacterium]